MAFPARTASGHWRWLSAAVVLLVGAELRGAAAGEAVAPGVITSVHRFWEIPDAAKAQRYHVRLELVVYYYDPQWQLLWAGGDDGVSFIQCGAKAFPIQAGQKILVDGVMSPASGMTLDDADVTVLADKVPLHSQPWQFQGTASEASGLPTQLVTMEGFVNRESEVDKSHLLLEVTVGGWPVQARVLVPYLSPEPECQSAFVKLQGVLVPNLTPAGQLSALALWIARPEDVKVTGWLSTDPRFKQTATLVEALPKVPAAKMIRVAGTVWGQKPGHSLTIRDSTGQVVVITGQTDPVAMGQPVEAIGFPAVQGNQWMLREGLYRRVTGNGSGETVVPTVPVRLRLAGQVLALSPEQAANGRDVKIFGVVTWADPETPSFYVNDASGGIEVMLEGGTMKPPVQGNTVEVEGISAMGDFAPVIKATSVTVAGSLGLPEARPVTLEQAMTGIEEGQWIELRGFLRDITRDGPWACLRLAAPAGEFAAYLPPAEQLSAWRGSVLRLRGVCSAVANARRQLVGVRLWVPSASSDYVQVEQPAPADPYSVPERTVAGLRQFSTLDAFNRRVRLNGIVLLQAPGRYFYLQDGTESIQVLSRDTTLLTPGDRVEAVGFPGRDGSRMVLREANYRRRDTGQEPEPTPLSGPETLHEELDGHLIQVTGTLLDVTVREQGLRLVVQAERAVFEAVIDRGPAPQMARDWPPGGRVALTGIYQIQFDEYRRPRAFQVQLRSPQDVAVLSRPSWWTPRRTWSAMGVLALCTALGIGWVATLRRRVHQQTTQIRSQMEKETRLEAELQRSQKLESLGVLAGGIAHDFNNLLTVIMGNLTLAKLDAGQTSTVVPWLREAEQGVMRARDLTLQLLTFAKGGDPVRQAHSLADIVRESAEFALHGSKVRCEFDLASNLWPAEVDKGQIGQVVQNIVINAIQAMPEGGLIRIGLGNAVVAAGSMPDLAGGRYLHLTIADTGVGMKPEVLSRIFDPYFTTKPDGTGLGLATVYSIVKRHQGRIEVQSKVGGGATFKIWLPAAQESPAATTPATSVPSPQQSGRILLMDDEEAIRRAAEALLKHIGLESVVVGDGRQALQEYSAARIAGRPFDLVILDLTVPGGMGGRETLEKLRQLDPEVRALVSSGYSSDPVLAHYRAHGFLGMVAKPYDITELDAAIRAILKLAHGRTA